MVTFSYPLQAHPCRASLDKVISTLLHLYRARSEDPSLANSPSDSDSITQASARAVTNEEEEGLLAPVGREDSTTGEVVLEVPKAVEEVAMKPMGQNRFVALTCCILLGGLTVALLVDDLEVVLSFVGGACCMHLFAFTSLRSSCASTCTDSPRFFAHALAHR
jgi:hypothetical protein